MEAGQGHGLEATAEEPLQTPEKEARVENTVQ